MYMYVCGVPSGAQSEQRKKKKRGGSGDITPGVYKAVVEEKTGVLARRREVKYRIGRKINDNMKPDHPDVEISQDAGNVDDRTLARARRCVGMVPVRACWLSGGGRTSCGRVYTDPK